MANKNKEEIEVVKKVGNNYQISFYNFLLDNEVDIEKYVENCKTKNNNWEVDDEEYYIAHIQMSRMSPDCWINYAFHWSKSEFGLDYCSDLDEKWRELLDKYEEISLKEKNEVEAVYEWEKFEVIGSIAG